MPADLTVDGGIRASVVIEAEPEEVFAYFVDETKMVEWLGQHVGLDPRVGGRLAIEVNGASVRGEYRVLEPPNRVVFSWGFAGCDALPPGASTVEVRLTRDGTATRVELIHTGLPVSEREEHHRGWRHFLGQLAAI